jgi:hypothetical protein
MPYAFLVLDEDVAKPFALTHAFLAVGIGFLIFLTYRSKNGVVVNALTFAAYVAGGMSLNVAAFLNSNPPVIYTIAGQFECMLMLFVAVRAPWVLTIPYGVAVIAVFVYIVTGGLVNRTSRCQYHCSSLGFYSVSGFNRLLRSR